MNPKLLLRRIVPAYLWFFLRNLISKRRNLRRVSENYSYDRARFIRYASPFRDLTHKEQLRSYVVMLAHGIEKGLALPEPRPGFGGEKIPLLLKNLEVYLRRYGNCPLIDSTLSALDEYVRFNQKHGLEMTNLAGRIEALWSARCGLSNAHREQAGGGTREVSSAEIHAACCFDLTDFFEYRFSVRQFAEKPVDVAQIRDAIKMAQKTPSVCNRQSGRVHVFSNDDLGARVLACQQGNLGFGNHASNILVVTSELGNFLSLGERNQCWIDGGMFAMSLVYALHSKGIGTCCLNWSVEKEADQQLRSVIGIAPSENIIMLIAVGHLPERLRVAFSQRRPLDEIATFHFGSESTRSMAKATSAAVQSLPLTKDSGFSRKSSDATSYEGGRAHPDKKTSA